MQTSRRAFTLRWTALIEEHVRLIGGGLNRFSHHIEPSSSPSPSEQPKSEQPEAVGSTGDQATSDNGVPSATVEGGDPSLLGDQLPSPDTSRDLPLPPSPSQPCDPTAAECAGELPVSGDDGTAHPSSSHEELWSFGVTA